MRNDLIEATGMFAGVNLAFYDRFAAFQNPKTTDAERGEIFERVVNDFIKGGKLNLPGDLVALLTAEWNAMKADTQGSNLPSITMKSELATHMKSANEVLMSALARHIRNSDARAFFDRPELNQPEPGAATKAAAAIKRWFKPANSSSSSSSSTTSPKATASTSGYVANDGVTFIRRPNQLSYYAELQAILRDSDSRQKLGDFMATQSNLENLLFLELAAGICETVSPVERVELFGLAFDNFINQKADKAVNFTSEVLKKLTDEWTEHQAGRPSDLVSATLLAEQAAYKMIAENSLKPFQASLEPKSPPGSP